MSLELRSKSLDAEVDASRFSVLCRLLREFFRALFSAGDADDSLFGADPADLARTQ